MKKLILSLTVIIGFTFYTVLYQRSSAANTFPSSPVPTVSTIPLATPALDQSSHSSQQTASTAPPTPPANNSPYRDGTFTGQSADAYYGNVQVAVSIQSGQLTDVQFLDYPQDRSTSRYINSQAMPMLKQEAIRAQSSRVDGVSGATDTSLAFVQSLSSALSQARK